MFHAFRFSSNGLACALALAAAVIVEPMYAQEKLEQAARQDQVAKPDPLVKPDFAGNLARPDGSMPLVLDWSTRHVVYTAGYSKEQAVKMAKDPRAYAAFLAHGMIRRPHEPVRPPLLDVRGTLKRDWAVSLGAGPLYPSTTSAAKYQFDVNAGPSCANDFVVFPIGDYTGYTRAYVVGTFVDDDPTPGQTTKITITPANDGPQSITLEAVAEGSATTATQFAISGSNNLTTDATNLAAAINLNIANEGDTEEMAAVPSGATVTVYSLTAGTQETLTTPATASPLNNFSWGSVTAGTNGSQANIVGLNNLYAGSSPFCTGFTDPTFIFSYAAGAGYLESSPVISLSGKKIAFIENDNSSPMPMGSILHVLTIGTDTEIGSACTSSNTGTAMATCATAPVVPGSTSGSDGADFMLPLQLAYDATLPATPEAPEIYNNYSSPFVNYSDDTLYVGDGSSYLYGVKPVFNGTPALASGFPVYLSGNPLTSPTVDAGGTGNVFVADTAGNLFNVLSTGTHGGVYGPTSIATSTAGGIADAPIVDSTAEVGYVVAGCNGTNSVLVEFDVTAGTAPGVDATANLSTDGCTGPYMMYDPAPDNNYYTKGISSGTAANNGEILVAYANATNSDLAQYQFTSAKTMSTSAEYTDTDSAGFAANMVFSPLTEFYGDDVPYGISALTQSGTTVTVTTATNKFVNNQVVVISGVASGTGCASNLVNAINGEQNISFVSATEFTFTSTVSGTITSGCGLGSADATGPTQDYLFFGDYAPEVYTFALPLTTNTQAPIATNTGDVSSYGTSAIIVDNDSSDGQASSIYYGTQNTSNLCGTTVYCGVKLTQSGLQ